MNDNVTVPAATARALEHDAPDHACLPLSLRESARLLKTLPVPLCVVDRQGRCRWVNDAFAAITGVPAPDHVGRDIGALGPAPDGALRSAFDQVIDTRTAGKLSATLPPDDAARRHVAEYTVHIQPIVLDDGRSGACGIFVPAADHAGAEAALRLSEARLAEAQRIAHLGNWHWDIVNNALHWSDEIYRIFGLQPQQFSATYDTFLERVHPDDRATVSRAVTAAIEGKSHYDIDHRIVLPDGSVRVVHEQGEVAFDEAGKALRMLGTVQDITSRNLAEQRIAASERELRAILRNMRDTYYRTGEDGRITRVSPSVTSLLGYAPEQVTGMSFDALFLHPAEYARFSGALDQHAGSLHDFELQLKRSDGAIVWSSINADCIRDAGGRVIGIEGTIRNVSERKKSESQMQKLSKALEQTADAAVITDPDGNIEYVNPAFEHITGYSREEVLGAKPSVVKSGKQRASFYKKMWQTILAGRVFTDIFINRRKDGAIYYEEKTITPLKDDKGNITHFVATGKDITERIQTEARLQYLAHHDALTDLPNRTLFMDRLNQALARAKLHDRLLAIMFIDLDRFKNINDTLGHDVGDRILKELAGRLQASIRAEDTVARLGGDEFAILLDDLTSINDATPLARKILDTMAPPTRLDGRELFVTASIGISLYPSDGPDAHTLLKNADIAMYRAKDLGKNNYQFYSTDMSAKAFERLTLENSLRHALERDELLLFYQPQVDIRSGRIIGVEALLRWRHPDLGLVGPADFVPLLEETGLIVETGQWVLETACAQARAWHDDGFHDLRVSVNLSGRQFNDPTFIDSIERAIRETAIDPNRLELEITESVIMRNARTTVTALNSLGDMGVRLSIDDFGTGYSSLSYLKRFPIDSLKIDRSFIRDVTSNADDAAIAHAIIVLGQSLKLEVIAEGVESPQQVEFLRNNGCDSMQGFLISQPLPAGDFRSLLRQGQR